MHKGCTPTWSVYVQVYVLVHNSPRIHSLLYIHIHNADKKSPPPSLLTLMTATSENIGNIVAGTGPVQVRTMSSESR